MRLHSLLCAMAAIVAAATPVSGNDLTDACHAFGSSEVIFVGRVKSAPIKRLISGEQDVENARIVMEAAERDVKAYEALKMPPEIGGGQLRDLVIRMMRARDAFQEARAMHPAPFELSLTPLIVETAFRGVTTSELFMMNSGQPELDPARSYLFYAERAMAPLSPDVISVDRSRELETAESDLQFLQQVRGDDGAVVHGSLIFEDPDRGQRTPMGGVVLRISLDGQRYETSTAADGTFMVSGVPPGMLRIEPVLPEHLMLPPQLTGGKVSGGCLAIRMRATLNGRVRGRVLLDSGEPLRGIVDLVRDDHTRHVPYRSDWTARTDEYGEYSFSGVPPGTYVVGINILRAPSAGSPFRPTYFPGTTDRSSAVPVTLGHGTEHAMADLIVSSRLAEGTMEVTLDTGGQPQKDMGVCVRTFDDDRPTVGASSYGRQFDSLAVIPVVEGVKYRLIAHARTPAGMATSADFDFIGEPGRQSVGLTTTSVTSDPNRHPCTVGNPKPFSPSR
jgi:hypothetical protein